MRIRSFHIDGFGIFSNVGLDSLAPGLSIFLGNNEAGKSTCLDFFRAMLTGYPDPRSKEARERGAAPLRGGQAGGSLLLETHRHGLMRLSRRPGNGGGLTTLTDAEGNPLDLSILDQILAGITREVYRNVFGFSLTELQSFETLNSEGVRHALYGASFGMGLRAPGQVLKILEDRMKALFKSGGSTTAVNTALRQWETLRRELEDAEKECACFDALALERDQNTEILAEMRRRRQEAEIQRRDMERRLGVWRQWDQWRTAGARLERLEDVPDAFPHDGKARLERARETLQEAARTVLSQQERHDRILAELETFEVDEDLLRVLPHLNALAERKESYRHAHNSLPSHTAALHRARAGLERQLTALGPEWTCERIRATDRSLFAREGLERQASAMQTATTVHVATMAALEKANNSVERAEREVEAARNALELLPVPPAALDDVGRDALRQGLARVEDLRRRLPERKQALQNARAAFTRAYAHLHVRSGIAPEQVLERLAAAQEPAMELAAAARSALSDAQTADQALGQAQAAEENAKGRADRLRAQLRTRQGPVRSTLDARAAALRTLRHLYNAFTIERDRQAENDARLHAMKAPAPLKSPSLMGIGIILMLSGISMLLARWWLNMASLDVTPTLSLPLTLWSGYLVVLTGVGFLAGGLPRSGPETRRHAIEMEQLRARHENGRLRLMELEAQLQEQCVIAEVPGAEPALLDAAEALLEREREQCVTDERLNLELAALEAEWNSLRERAALAQAGRAQAEAAVQKARRHWHEFLQSYHVDNIPAQEAATAFFARVEAARLAYAGMVALEQEAREMETQLTAQEAELAALPPVASLLTPPPLNHAEDETGADLETEEQAPPPNADRLLWAARQVVEACREADAAEEKRIQAKAALHNAEINLERASTVQSEAMDALRRSEDAQGAAREGWSSMLKELGLGLDLSPGTVREALECMERCLTAEAETARLDGELERLKRERDAFVEPLAALEERLGRAVGQTDDEENDWVARLDALLTGAQAQEDARRRKTLLYTRLEEFRDELTAARRVQNDAEQALRELLDMAGARSEEEFLRLAEIHAEHKELTRRREDLEDALRLAAADSPLEEFLASFAHLNQEECETQAAALTAEIVALGEQEQELNTRLAALTAKLQNLTTADHLAALRQREADMTETLRRMAHDWARHALARHLLIQAKRRFEEERQPQVIRAASEIFAAVTERRWSGLTASLEDSALNVLPPHGEPISPEQLSRGAQEQIYLAMRLAYIRNHAAHATALPVIADDILVNFDPARARRAADALLDLAREGGRGVGHQILFFTCHPHIADMLQELMPDSGRYLVDGGGIREA